MNAFLKIVSTALLLLLPLAACAAPAKPAAAYSLKLSLGKDWNTSYTHLPVLTETFINSGPYTLMFAEPVSFPQFVVEYKPITGDPKAEAGWQGLSSLEPPPARKHGRVVDGATWTLIARISPLTNGGPAPYGNKYDLVGFPMAADGFHRITAVAKIPEARELTGSANALTEARRSDLNLCSNSIIIRRTASGFTVISPV